VAEPPVTLSDAMKQKVRELVGTTLDIAIAPPFKVTLIMTGGDYVMVVSIHHIITDGWSTGIMLGELEEVRCARCPLLVVPGC
jgi:hypothetical protein